MALKIHHTPVNNVKDSKTKHPKPEPKSWHRGTDKP